MTFITVTELQQIGILTNEFVDTGLIYSNNVLDVTGDVEFSGTINFITTPNIVKNTIYADNLITDFISSKELITNNSSIKTDIITTDITSSEIQSGIINISGTSLNTNNNNNIISGSITATSLNSNSLNSNTFSVSSTKNLTGLNDITTDTLTTTKSVIVGQSSIQDSNLKTTNTSATAIVSGSINNKFKNVNSVVSDSLAATSIAGNNLLISNGSILLKDITNINSVISNSTNVFDNITELSSTNLKVNSILTTKNITTEKLNGTTTFISGAGNVLNNGKLTTTKMDISSNLLCKRIVSNLSDIEIDNCVSINGVNVSNGILDFKNINTLDTISSSNIGDDLIKRNITITGNTTISGLHPSKIITDTINADSINNTSVSDTLLITNKLNNRNTTVSGNVDLTSIKSVFTITVDANVDVETTLFQDGDIITGTLITSKKIKTPLLDNVTNITSTEHYFGKSIINGITFDDDGISGASSFDVSGITTKDIKTAAISKPITFGTIDIDAVMTGNNVNTINYDTGVISTNTITSTDGDILDISTTTLSVSEPMDGISDNTINVSSIKTLNPSTISKDVYASTIQFSDKDAIYKVQVHAVSDAELSFPFSGLSGSVGGVKLVKDLIILMKDQSTDAQNGVYVASETTWSRHKSMLNASDTENAIVSTSYGKYYKNSSYPSILFVEVSGILLGNHTINTTTDLISGNIISNNNVYSTDSTANNIITGTLALSSGFLDITTEPTINTMTTSGNHLGGVANLDTDNIAANDVAVTNLQVSEINSDNVSFGGVSFSNKNISSANDLTVDILNTKSIKPSGTIIANDYLSSSSINNNLTNSDSINTSEATTTSIKINNVSVSAPTGTYNLKIPNEYSTESNLTAITRTATEDNVWETLPEIDPTGQEGHLQINNNQELSSTDELTFKSTSLVEITITDQANSISNSGYGYIDGVYPYSDDFVSFNLNVSSGILSLSNLVIPGNWSSVYDQYGFVTGDIHSVVLEIPVNNKILKTTKIAIGDLNIKNDKITNVNDVLMTTPGDINLKNIKYNNTELGKSISANSVSNGVISILPNNTIIGVSAPTLDGHPSTKGYADTELQTFDWTASVDHAYNNNVTTYSVGVFTNLNITSVNGISFGVLQDGQTLLLTGQTDKIENGIYVIGDNKTTLTRTLTGQVGGKSTHVKYDDSVYVCVGNSITAGTDESYYTKIIDGQYTFTPEFINNGELKYDSSITITAEKISTNVVPVSKLTQSSVNIKDGVFLKSLALGGPNTSILVSNNKSFLAATETYTGNKTFNKIISNSVINVSNDITMPGVVSTNLPFLSTNDASVVNVDAVNVNLQNTTTTDTLESENVITNSIKSNTNTTIEDSNVAYNNLSSDSIHVNTITIKDVIPISVGEISSTSLTLSGTGVYPLDTVVLVKDNTTGNGIYIVKNTNWAKINAIFATKNGIVYRIHPSGLVEVFDKAIYDLTNTNSIGHTYIADYYSVNSLITTNLTVDGQNVEIGEKVLIKDDDIYIVSETNWIKTNYLHEGDTCVIQGGNLFKNVSFKLVSGQTELNYNHVVDYVIYGNVSLTNSDKPNDTRLLLINQTNTNENGLYTVTAGDLINTPLSGLSEIITLETNKIFVTDGTVFYTEPTKTVNYHGKPLLPNIHDTYTDGSYIFRYNTEQLYENIYTITNEDFVFIASLKKVLSNNTLIPILKVPPKYVNISGIKFRNDRNITNVNEILPENTTDNITINTNKVGSGTNSGLNVYGVSISAPKIITKAETTIINDLITDNFTVKKNIHLTNDINYENLTIDSDVSLNSTLISQTGTKVSGVVQGTNVPSGLNGFKHGNFIFMTNLLEVYKVNKEGPWTRVIPAPPAPFIFGSLQYSSSGVSTPFTTHTTDIKSNVINATALNSTTDLSSKHVKTATFNSDSIDIYGNNISIGKKYLKAITYSNINIPTSSLDPLLNAIDTGSRGFVNTVQIYPDSQVLLLNQTNPADNGLYITKVGNWVKIPNTSNLSFKANNKYYDYQFNEIFPVENSVINTTTSEINTPYYVTETSITRDTSTTVNVFKNVKPSITIGSNTTAINTKNINAKNLNLTNNVSATNMTISKNLIPGNVILEGNILSDNTLKFDKSISLNSVELSDVNDLQINEDVSCNSMVTPAITHSGSFDIRSLSADTVIENVSLSRRNLKNVPLFNGYEFSGLHNRGNVKQVFTSTQALNGEHSGLLEGDVVIINEPLGNVLTDENIQITNTQNINEITITNLSVSSVSSGGQGFIFKQTDTDKLTVFADDSYLGNVLNLVISGYTIPETNGVFRVSVNDWESINNDTDRIISVSTKYFQKDNTNNLIKLPFKIEGILTTTSGSITKLTDDSFIIKDTTGSTINYTNRKAFMKNIFTYSDKIYIQDKYYVSEKEWVKVNYVSNVNVQIPTLTTYIPIIIQAKTVLEDEKILLINQTNAKENGIYVLKNKLLQRPSGYDEQDQITEFVWDTFSGFGYYVSGIIGNYIITYKTHFAHPHSSEKIILNKLITSDITSPLTDVSVFKNAQNVLLESRNIISGLFNTDNISFVSPLMSVDGNIFAKTSTISTTELVVKSNINSVNNINIKSNLNVSLNGLDITANSAQIDDLFATTVNARSLVVDTLNSNDYMNLPSEITYKNVKILSNEIVIPIIESLDTLNADTLSTSNITLDNINTTNDIIFTANNVNAIKIKGKTISIPQIELSEIVGEVLPFANTDVMSTASNVLNMFSKANTLNLNTIQKTSGYNSQLNMKFRTLDLSASKLNINSTLTNNTDNVILYGNMVINNINTSNNLTLGGDGENITLGEETFKISSKLNKVNFTTDLEIESFLDKSLGVSVGNRDITNTLTLDTNQTVNITSKNMNISYLENLPNLVWKSVDIICDYYLDTTIIHTKINGTTLVPEMTVLLTKNGVGNAVYLVQDDLNLLRFSNLKISEAYHERYGTNSSFYVKNVSNTEVVAEVSTDTDLEYTQLNTVLINNGEIIETEEYTSIYDKIYASDKIIINFNKNTTTDTNDTVFDLKIIKADIVYNTIKINHLLENSEYHETLLAVPSGSLDVTITFDRILYELIVIINGTKQTIGLETFGEIKNAKLTNISSFLYSPMNSFKLEIPDILHVESGNISKIKDVVYVV